MYSNGGLFMPENQRQSTSNRSMLVTGEEYLARKNAQNYRYDHQKPQKKPFPVRIVIIAVCAVVFCVSGFHLVNYFSDIHQSRNSTESLREIYASGQTESTAIPQPVVTDAPAASPAPALYEVNEPVQVVEASAETPQNFADHWPSSYEQNPELIISESFNGLRAQNRDIVGWLNIEGVLDEPVMQRDNEFYLNHDATQKKNVTGALFLDENCNLRTLTPNLVIHGHNMKEGAMFGVLKKYKLKDASFYKTHPFIQLNTLYEESTYVIFAVTEISLNPKNHYYLPFWNYLEFDSEKNYYTFINRVREYSHFQTGVDVRPGDRLLTLATCAGTDNADRLLIVARRVRDGENTIELQRGILSTTVK